MAATAAKTPTKKAARTTRSAAAGDVNPARKSTVAAKGPVKRAARVPRTEVQAKAAAIVKQAAEAVTADMDGKAKAKHDKKDAAKKAGAKKEKVVRDSFTMPKADYEKIALLKKKCLEAGVAVKKSELLRAGLRLLEATSDKRLLAAVAAVETVKTGRPAKSV